MENKKYLFLMYAPVYSGYIENLFDFTAEGVDQKTAFYNLIKTQLDDVVSIISSCLLEMKKKNLTNKPQIGLKVDKLVKKFIDQGLDEKDSEESEFQQFFLDNIDDVVDVFMAYNNVEYLKIR